MYLWIWVGMDMPILKHRDMPSYANCTGASSVPKIDQFPHWNGGFMGKQSGDLVKTYRELWEDNEHIGRLCVFVLTCIPSGTLVQ